MKYSFQKLKNWQDFELLCKDVMNKKLSLDFLQFGRPGQKQKGIDFYAVDYSNNVKIAIQCKKTDKLTMKQIEEDIEKIFEKGIEEVEEININNIIREYEEEYCNFSNKKWIFKSLLRSYINKTDLGLWDIQLLVLLNEEIEKLRNNDEDSQILKEWIRDIFENESKKN